MSSQGWAPYVAAIAAVFSGVNLYVAGRREDRSWVRAALEGAFVDFLTACYDERGACSHMVRLGVEGKTSRRTEEEWQAIANEAHEVALDCLTRLRVLASDDTADLARRLMRHTDKSSELARQQDFVGLKSALKESTGPFTRDRDLFTARARQLLGIRHAGRGRFW